MNKNSRFTITLFFAGFIFISPLVAAAQDQIQQNSSTILSTPEKLLEIKVGDGNLSSIAIKSRNVSVEEITSELSRHIKIPFALSRTVSNYKPGLDLAPQPLEGILKNLAPFVIVEKRLIGGMSDPKIEGIYLYAYNEDIPVMKDGSQLSNLQTYVYEGNTESRSGESIESGDSLIVKYKDEKLSLTSKDRYSLSVAAKIAEEIGVPLSVRENSTEKVNIQFEKLNVGQAFRLLPANISLKYWNKLDGSAPIFTEMIFGKF